MSAYLDTEPEVADDCESLELKPYICADLVVALFDGIPTLGIKSIFQGAGRCLVVRDA